MKRSLSLGAKITYAVLCDYASTKHHCWPSHGTLAARLGCSASSVKKYLYELAGEKLIVICAEPGHSSRYYMLLPPELARSAAKVIALSPCPDREQAQPIFSRTQPDFTRPQAEFGYRNTLNKQENRNPPLPPARATPPSPPPAQRRIPVGGGGVFSPDFEKAWAIYPKKEAQGLARHAWKQLERNGELPSQDVLLAAIGRFAGSEQWQRENGRFVPQMGNWLRGQRWKDPLSPVEEEKAKQRELVAAQAQREKERQTTKEVEKEPLRTLYRAFTAKFGPTKDHNDYACGLWKYLHAKGMAPSPDDVPDDNTLSLVDFLHEFKRKRKEEAWLAGNPLYEASAKPIPTLADALQRENSPVACGDYLRTKGLLDNLLKQQGEALCKAV